MADSDFNPLLMLYKPHPWHGIAAGEDVPNIVNAFIEIVPTDTVKYEIDKPTGYLKIDRPQKFSSLCPTLYGFIPQTYCGERVGAYCSKKTRRKGIVGDGDPLDICVISEKAITHGDVIVRAVPIGGLRMVDGDQADDKIIAIMKDDGIYGGWKDIKDCPAHLVDRLRHYFLTYKQIPGSDRPKVEITHVYSRAEAEEVIAASIADYRAEYGDASAKMQALTALLGTKPRNR